jgi:hypothetical protein
MAFEKIFEGDGTTFSALYEAQKWLRDNGYSYGSSSIDSPIGVHKGDCYISKWRNMTKKEQKNLDGRLYAGREGSAKLVLKEPPTTTNQLNPSILCT